MQKLLKKLLTGSKNENTDSTVQNRYTIEKKVANGSFGRVYLVFDKKDSIK